MLSSDGFLAPASYFAADLALVGELLFYVLICVAVVAQRRGRGFNHSHRGHSAVDAQAAHRIFFDAGLFYGPAS